MGHKDSDKKKESHKRQREDKGEKSSLRFLWLIPVGSHKEKAKTEKVKEVEKKVDAEEEKTEKTPSVPEEEQPEQPEQEDIGQPRKRMRTRSMDMEEEESLYSMRRYRISPETIGILNSHGITELFPIQAIVVAGCYS